MLRETHDTSVVHKTHVTHQLYVRPMTHISTVNTATTAGSGDTQWYVRPVTHINQYSEYSNNCRIWRHTVVRETRDTHQSVQ